MSFSGQTLTQQAQIVEAKTKQIINADLKEICRKEGLAVSGVKASLQSRIITLLKQCAEKGDVDRFNRIRYRVYNHGQDPPPAGAPGSGTAPMNLVPSNGLAPNLPPPPYAMPPSAYRPVPAQDRPLHPGFASANMYNVRFAFKESPFYERLQPLLQPIELAATPNHRNSAQRNLTLPADVVDRLRSDESLRIMLYSAQDPILGPYAKADVAFPTQLEVKINGDEVKANFKGLKNKPGSTRPVDITDSVRRITDYKNVLYVTYALTSKVNQKYVFVIYLVKRHSVEELVERIRRGSVIAKQTVLNEMRSKANDPDIVAVSTVMSLKDPLVMSRISLPCRSSVCTHNQCFDATAFLQLQEQAPTWTCPICNKTVSFEGLAVDQYVQEILQQTSRSTDQVTIEPDGKWSTGAPPTGPATSNGAHKNDPDSDDDIVEVSDYRINNIKAEATNTPISLARTPPMSSREPSMVNSAAPHSGTGSKRTHDVVDLTLSDDDEDDEPVRPNKRVAYSTPNSNPDPVRKPSFGQPSLLPNNFAMPVGGVGSFRIPGPQSPQRPPGNVNLVMGQPQPQPQPPPYPQQHLQRSQSGDLWHRNILDYGSPP
ncbi:E3 SUMO-protein ligase pli1 [Coniosporium tulheliwenetii]|uniref:E3 SUMO-protein ligase pli1 n=1 Tax=Coniosporium tulheliwenetii TaxID=3383036 RepID=A0ACC2Z6S0_9PEZI|nr:E3 SUMO-protein ligase pli1 [Cladosporium sp. JES 115]